MLVGITGGTGFIGQAIVARHLDRGDRVRVLSRRSRDRVGLPDAVEIVQGDLIGIGARESLKVFAAGLDVLYHCAGEIRDESRMHALHMGGTRTLLEAAVGQIGRWVQLSSVGVYGPHRVGVVTEGTAPNPGGLYEVTKKASDDLVIAARERGDLESFTVLRPSIVFGANMPNRSIFQMVRMIELGLFFFIGAPGASANYIVVSNVVDALVLCATQPQAADRIYNLSDWSTMEDFVGAISTAVGRFPPRVRIPETPVRLLARTMELVPRTPLTESRVDAMVNRARYSIDRIQSELGYAHAVSIADGLRNLVAAREAI